MDLMIASDAFVEQSQITLERKARSSLEGNLTAGVVDEPPLKVELLTDGQSCYLTRVGTEQTVRLTGVSCKPIENQG
jgi:hypothetical protein